MQQSLVLTPAKWVTEDVLTLVTGLKPGMIKRAREQSWLLGREYVHVSADSDPKPNNQCMYKVEAIERWIDSLVKRQPV
ncbi:excisionase family protein [Rosenbergiella collisarenosi]|uniref:excisionase family protein n=1 Tax=Rosenbergiella collisarenosi TaxID=1544695 RepID=UPI001F5029E4|nr:excisionase family protein [Rosenbergiella collisarenosi]